MDPTRRRLLRYTTTLAASGLLAGCLGSSGDGTTTATRTTATGTTEPPTNRTRSTTSTPEPNALDALVAGNDAFALDLLDALSANAQNENQFLSPYSASLALAMTEAGARGKTRTQMRETLHFSLPEETLHRTFGSLHRTIDSYGPDATPTETTTETPTAPGSSSGSETPTLSKGIPFELTDANALWGQSGFPYSHAFLHTLETDYGAALHEVDFREHADRARRKINRWVNDRTKRKIQHLLQEGSLDERTRLVLTNAIYFEANWSHHFPEDATHDATFTNLDGSASTVSMMRQKNLLSYAEVEGHQLVELPYVGDAVGMVVVLPAAGAFESFQQDLTADRLRSLFDAMEETHGTVSLPRFEVRSKLQLKDVLANLGMSIAFTGGADFSGMVDGATLPLQLDDVVQEAFVHVDEHGTEAAAATAVEVKLSSASTDPFEMTVNRPFLFLIRDERTGTVLFLGRVVDGSTV